jgi:hypothetical protein
MIWGRKKRKKQTHLSYHPKRYSAYSLIDRFNGYKQVFVTWFCCQREAKPGGYSHLVANYHRLQDHLKTRAELYIDNLFAKQEVALLKRQVKKTYGFEVYLVCESFPMVTDKYLNYIHPEIMVDHRQVEILDLPMPKSCPVRFKVRGISDFRNCQPAAQPVGGDTPPIFLDKLDF